MIFPDFAQAVTIAVPFEIGGRRWGENQMAMDVRSLTQTTSGDTMGFFAWLREGVRRAVLLGFSDAIAQIGDRRESDDLGPQLAAALQQGIALDDGKAALSGPASSGRKRLGKSLEQIAQSASG